MKNMLILCLLIAGSTWCVAQSADEKHIRGIFDKQTIAWNKGDLVTFMEGYWKNDSLMFVGKTGVTYGYNNTLERYRKYYPDQKTMGTLSVDILHVRQISPDHFFVVGKYILERADDKPEGHFTVIFRKIEGEWKIICDHSS